MPLYDNAYPLGAGEQGTRKDRPSGAPATPQNGAPSLIDLLRPIALPVQIRMNQAHACAFYPVPLTSEQEQALSDAYAAWVPTDPPADP